MSTNESNKCSNGLLIAIVLFILLAIILSSAFLY